MIWNGNFSAVAVAICHVYNARLEQLLRYSEARPHSEARTRSDARTHSDARGGDV